MKSSLVYRGSAMGSRVAQCAPGRIRTCDLRIRNPLLYPAELRERGREFTRSAVLGKAADGCKEQICEADAALMLPLSAGIGDPTRGVGLFLGACL